MEVIRLVRIDFDNLENRDARRETEIGVFGPSATGSALAAVKSWFAAQAAVDLYVGWDHGVYPQFRLETKVVQCAD